MLTVSSYGPGNTRSWVTMMVNALPGRTSMGRAIFIPRWMSSDEVWPSCWPTAVPRTSSALGPPKARPKSGIWLSWTPALTTSNSSPLPKTRTR